MGEKILVEGQVGRHVVQELIDRHYRPQAEISDRASGATVHDLGHALCLSMHSNVMHTLCDNPKWIHSLCLSVVVSKNSLGGF